MFSQHHFGMSLLMGPFSNRIFSHSVIRLLLTVKLIDPKRRKEDVNKNVLISIVSNGNNKESMNSSSSLWLTCVEDRTNRSYHQIVIKWYHITKRERRNDCLQLISSLINFTIIYQLECVTIRGGAFLLSLSLECTSSSVDFNSLISSVLAC